MDGERDSRDDDDDDEHNATKTEHHSDILNKAIHFKYSKRIKQISVRFSSESNFLRALLFFWTSIFNNLSSR